MNPVKLNIILGTILLRQETMKLKMNKTQTDAIATNTEALTYDEVLKIDSNGKIHLNEREILLDVRVGHKPNTWEEIETMFQGKLKLKMLRRTWISNNGNLFKTTIGNWQ